MEEWGCEDTAERVRGLYNYRRSCFSARFGGDEAMHRIERDLDLEEPRLVA